ncbi:MAG TPA: lipocalin-like domain-containing protein [Thermoanaerobaculia bacterium]|nr:lipocalin-like domain-containing protein [Thermoanaerobaculia bacterium]
MREWGMRRARRPTLVPRGAAELRPGRRSATRTAGHLLALGLTVLLAACAGEEPAIESRLAVAEVLGGGDTAGYAVADRPRRFAFPADHGAHPDFRTEWWYFTGNLATAGGRRFGYQLTVFRSALAPPPDADGAGERASAWATRQVWMGHLALTDVAGRRFRAAEKLARGGDVGLAGARTAPFRVWVEDWQARSISRDSTADAAPFLPLRLTAAGDDAALDLVLAPGKPLVLQGEDGLSRKGREAGAASYYYSLTRLPTRGTVTVGGERFAVTGASWLDREWSTSVLGSGERGWDWLSLQLADGRDVVAWRIRGRGDAPGAIDYAAVVTPQGELRVLDAAAARLDPTGTWRSPATGALYPSGWRLSLPGADAGGGQLEVVVEPLLRDQELDLSVRYWEGAVRVENVATGGPAGSAGAGAAGYGYVELTGYGDGG